jgi:hypothetical protein
MKKIMKKIMAISFLGMLSSQLFASGVDCSAVSASSTKGATTTVTTGSDSTGAAK